MLQLKNITKRYDVAGNVIMALDDVSLCFRKNEFVAILGPSGCGKTTMLNILGGLDRYTSGDLVINGTSTKLYKDRDWDVYRNHRIGFVFQSYNLIPHQTILGNVELALTIAGFSKAERVEKAKKALDKVGLEGQYYKRPNQLSGGQMQRVAIARALVNDPDIILADEPTGALDTKTSVQVMDLLKEVASDRLVVMVTHNPELADAYANRIVKLRDGKVIDDSNPFSAQECEDSVALVIAKEKEEEEKLSEKERKAKAKKKNKAKMSLFTAFRLSAQNLFSKKARTILTSVAGAIGIIGVSLVLSFSYGIQSYINSMQNDMLSGNPIKIEQKAYDFTTLVGSLTPEEKNDIVRKDGHISVDNMVQRLIGMSKAADSVMIENTITQDYVDYINGIPSEHIAEIHYDYGLDVTGSIYTEHTKKVSSQGFGYKVNDDKETCTLTSIGECSDTEVLIPRIYKGYTVTNIDANAFKDCSSLISVTIPKTVTTIGENAFGNFDTLTIKCEPTSKPEGWATNWTTLDAQRIKWGAEYAKESKNEVKNMSINAIRGSYIQVLEETIFEKYASYVTSVVQNFKQAPTSTKYLLEQYDLVGENSRIATKKDEIMLVLDSNDLATDVLLAQLGYYTQEEFLHLICDAEKEVDAEFKAWYGKEEYHKDTFSIEEILGKEFEWFPNDVIYGEASKAPPSSSYFGTAITAKYEPYRKDTWKIAQDINNVADDEGIKLKVVGILRPKDGISYGCLSSGFYYTEELAQHAIKTGKKSNIVEVLNELMTKDGVAPKANDTVYSAISYTVDVSYLGDVLYETQITKEGIKKEQNSIYLGDSSLSSAIGSFLSNSKMSMNTFSLQLVGGVDLPATISIYPTDFNNKQAVLDYLDKWNADKGNVTFISNGETKTLTREQRDDIIYSDMLSIVFGLINQFIEIITIALIGFTSLSLVVSTFMIAIITYVSVVERVKEIGVIRSLGGRKKDVSRLFTAETVMIGFASGAFGIGITYLVSGIVNAIVSALAGIPAIAVFPLSYALIMMGISIGLTLISGVFPASAAAKKDPVIALRTE